MQRCMPPCNYNVGVNHHSKFIRFHAAVFLLVILASMLWIECAKTEPALVEDEQD